jgi:hypothetical protein
VQRVGASDGKGTDFIMNEGDDKEERSSKGPPDEAVKKIEGDVSGTPDRFPLGRGEVQKGRLFHIYGTLLRPEG